MPKKTHDLLRSAEVAAILHVGSKTVGRYRTDGIAADDGEQLYLVPAARTPGGHYLFDRETVLKFQRLTAERVTRPYHKRKT